jgi:hypothetical protein
MGISPTDVDAQEHFEKHPIGLCFAVCPLGLPLDELVCPGCDLQNLTVKCFKCDHEINHEAHRRINQCVEYLSKTLNRVSKRSGSSSSPSSSSSSSSSSSKSTNTKNASSSEESVSTPTEQESTNTSVTDAFANLLKAVVVKGLANLGNTWFVFCVPVLPIFL